MSYGANRGISTGCKEAVCMLPSNLSNRGYRGAPTQPRILTTSKVPPSYGEFSGPGNVPTRWNGESGGRNGAVISIDVQ